MIIDASMFFNEVDILELRLSELDSIVDKFVIVESLETFGSTRRKESVFEANRSRFAKFEHKIHYVLLPELSPVFTDSASGWQREKFQRDSLMGGIVACSTSPEDVIIVSDVDEIPRASVVLETIPKLSQGIHRFNLDFFYYNVNCRVGEWPWGTTLGTVAQYQHVGGVHQARSNNYHDSNRVIPDAGWHFSYFGSVADRRNKVASFSHASDDFCQAFLARGDDEAKKDIANRQDIYRTRGLNQFEHRRSDDPTLPAYFLANAERFKHLTEEA